MQPFWILLKAVLIFLSLFFGTFEGTFCFGDVHYGSEGENLTLSQALDRGIANNRDVQDQKLILRAAEIIHKNAWDTMFLPSVSLNLSTSSSKTLSHLLGDTYTSLLSSYDSHGYTVSSASLNLGSYTFYNFGKDLLVYEKAYLDWTRAQEALDEAIRSIKFQIIVAYWTLKTSYDKVDSANRSIEIAQAMAELQESRYNLGKTTQADYESSAMDLFTARNLRDQLETNSRIALFSLNTFLGDPIGTKYHIEEEISFLPISLNEDIVYESYQKNSPIMKSAKNELRKAELSLSLEQRNRLPLPTFSFSGITVSYSNHYYGSSPDLYTSATGNPNFNVSAYVSLTVPILGYNGLFGWRAVETAHIDLERAELKLRDSSAKDRSLIFQHIQNIRQVEVTVQNNRESLIKSVDVMESVFQKYFSGAVSRLELRDAITQARSAEISLSEGILFHLSSKMQLAQLIGVDYLPRLDQ